MTEFDHHAPPPLAGDSADDDTLWRIFSGSRNPMLLADDQRRYINANAAACRLLGYDVAALRMMRIDDITIPEYRPFLDDIWAEFLQRGGTIGTFSVLTADGTTVDVEFSATANIVPGLHLSIFINPDVVGEAGGLADVEGDKSFDEPVRSVQSRSGALLDDTEWRVVTLLALGLRWHEAADAIGSSAADLRAVMESAMDKLGARTRAHAVSVAIRAGEIDPSDPPIA